MLAIVVACSLGFEVLRLELSFGKGGRRGSDASGRDGIESRIEGVTEGCGDARVEARENGEVGRCRRVVSLRRESGQ